MIGRQDRLPHEVQVGFPVLDGLVAAPQIGIEVEVADREPRDLGARG